jgi:hypothetical protein
MKVMLKAFHDGKSPGQVHEFDDVEAERQIAIGGARVLTEAELAAHDAQDAADKQAAEKARLKSLTVKELTQLAAGRGIKIADGAKKDDILAALDAAASATPASPSETKGSDPT